MSPSAIGAVAGCTRNDVINILKEIFLRVIQSGENETKEDVLLDLWVGVLKFNHQAKTLEFVPAKEGDEENWENQRKERMNQALWSALNDPNPNNSKISYTDKKEKKSTLSSYTKGSNLMSVKTPKT